MKWDPDAERKLLEALKKVGPLSIGMSYRLAHANYHGGVDDPGRPGSTTGGSKCVTGDDHSMLLTGYGYDPVSGLDYWKLQNNQGASWGEHGYYRLARGKDHCGVAWYAYHARVTPPDRFHCQANTSKCVKSFGGHPTLKQCKHACA